MICIHTCNIFPNIYTQLLDLTRINFLEYPIPATATAVTAATATRHKKRRRPDLRSQAWYHRSAGVKTTGKNSE